jgi:hypothetical protein
LQFSTFQSSIQSEIFNLKFEIDSGVPPLQTFQADDEFQSVSVKMVSVFLSGSGVGLSRASLRSGTAKRGTKPFPSLTQLAVRFFHMFNPPLSTSSVNVYNFPIFQFFSPNSVTFPDMIFLFGTRLGHLKTVRVSGECVHCKNTGTVELITDQRYAHVMWIPIFPLGKVFSAECYRCRKVYSVEEIIRFYPESYHEVRRKLGIPLWSFAGPLIIIAFISFILIAGYFRKTQEEEIIHSPQAGDIYKYKQNGLYSLLKVSRIAGDTVYVHHNNYGTEGIVSMRRMIERSQFDFDKESKPILQRDLLEMFDKGEIVDVERE